MMSPPSSSPISGNKVYIHTLGCAKNDADSRGLSRTLSGAGVAVVTNPEDATHIVINTCGFIQDAKEESIGAILDACSNFGGERVLVTGCLVERYRRDLEAEISEVAGWFGLSEFAELAALLSGPESAAAVAPADVVAKPADNLTYAYLKISDGCDEMCTFCAIPGIKGPYYSVPAADIIAEARACAIEGARELVLVGQDTAVWAGDGLTLEGLIERLLEDERIRRVRLMYLQPEHVTDSLLEYMAREPRLCRYLDIPLQHANAEVLKRMGRWGAAAEYLELLAKARRLMPDVVVRSTFIVGFPGETDEQFEQLLDFVDEAEFDYAGGFIYSPEEGTSAASLKPRVKAPMARDRLARLTAALAERAEQLHGGLVGSTAEVMIDSLDPQELEEGIVAVGRTAGQAPEVDGVTYIEGVLPPGCKPGDIILVKISEVVGYDLVGEYGLA